MEVTTLLQVLDPLAQSGKGAKFNRVKAREKKMAREWSSNKGQKV